MQVYYDEDKKVWVLPVEDPPEITSSLPPPPTALAAIAPATPVPASNDPLATMMAPPTRAPPSLRKPKVPGKETATPVKPPILFVPTMRSAEPSEACPSKADDDIKQEAERGEEI